MAKMTDDEKKKYKDECDHFGHFNGVGSQIIGMDPSGQLIMVISVVCSNCGAIFNPINLIGGVKTNNIVLPNIQLKN